MESISTCSSLPWKASIYAKPDSSSRRNLKALECSRARISRKIYSKCRRKAKAFCFDSFHGLRYGSTVRFGAFRDETAQNFGPVPVQGMKTEATKGEKMAVFKGSSKGEIMYKTEKMDIIEGPEGRINYNHEKMKVIEWTQGGMLDKNEQMKVIDGAKAELVYNNQKRELQYEIYSYQSNVSSVRLDSYQQEEEEEEERQSNQVGSYHEEGNRSSNLKRNVSSNILGLKQWWKSIHEVYREDTQLWGFGSSAIFTVYEGKGGKIEKVIIDENEIKRRQGFEPLLPGPIDDTMKAQCEDKINLAHAIAKEIEIGHIKPKKNSTVFNIVKTICQDANKSSYQQTVDWAKYVLHVSAPSVKSFILIAMPIYGFLIIWNAFLVRRKESDSDDIEDETSATRLEKMRKLKARINSIHGNTTLEQGPLEQSDFMRKLLEVREMARQVRLDEASQNLREDSTNVMEYNLEDELVTENNNMIEVNNDAEKGGTDVEMAVAYDLEDRNVSETHVVKANSDSENVQIEEKHDCDDFVAEKDFNSSQVEHGETNVIRGDLRDINNKISVDIPTMNGSAKKCKPKPRIIMSLEEAKAVLDGKKSRLSSINKNDEKPTYQMKHQVPENSVIANSSYKTPGRTRPNAQDNSEPMQFGDVEEFRDRVGGSQGESEALEGETSNYDTETKEQPSGTTGMESSVHYKHLDGGKDPDERADLRTLNNLNPIKRNDMVEMNSKVLVQDSQSSGTKKILINNGTRSDKTKDIIGSGRPLREKETFSNTKQWSKELQRKYDSERDPRVRELMKEIGSELQTWVTEEEIEDARRIASKLEQGDDSDDDGIGKRYQEVRKKIENEKKTFGAEAVLEKYREYQAKPEDELWWLDLRYVLCLLVSSKQDGGFYGVDMEIEELKGDSKNQRVKHVVAFEDRKDALKFGRLLEHDSGSGFQRVDICPFSPKQLFRMAKEEGFKITVLRTGQIDVSVESNLEEAEDQIVAIGKRVYWEREERKHSIDIDSILHQRFGL